MNSTQSLSTRTPTILVVEDDLVIIHVIRQALEQAGFAVITAQTCENALLQLENPALALVLLDLNLPDGSGFNLITRIRAFTHVPILILSAKQLAEDKIVALDRGADDFLSKPFVTGELLARIRALLRRQHSSITESRQMTFGDVEVDLLAREVKKSGTIIHLSPIEFQLLTLLLHSQGRVLTHQELLKAIWHKQAADHSHYLRIYMGHLRKKLEDNPARPSHFLTETGIGYRFRMEAST